MRTFFYLLTMVFLVISCSQQNTFEEILFRTTKDPFDDTPFANSLTLEHTIYLSWESDDACDKYRLMRSYDQSVLNFFCVYEGTATNYIDVDLNDSNRYIYKLDKIRGDKYFNGSFFAYGYSSDCREDECEPNDIELKATYLEYDLICNLPCVRYVTNNKESIDCDWFYIKIPPRRAADIVVNQHNLENESEGAATNLKIQISGSESAVVKQKIVNVINNTSYETKKFFFKIYPETTKLFSHGSNTAIIEYTVSLNQIRNY